MKPQTGKNGRKGACKGEAETSVQCADMEAEGLIQASAALEEQTPHVMLQQLCPLSLVLTHWEVTQHLTRVLLVRIDYQNYIVPMQSFLPTDNRNFASWFSEHMDFPF